MILGLYNKSKHFLLPYIIYDGIRIIITILAFVFVTILFHINHIVIGVLSACVFQMLSIVLVFIWITVLSTYLNFRKISYKHLNSSASEDFQEQRRIQRTLSLGRFSNGRIAVNLTNRTVKFSRI